jgi:hypothetical protein
LPALACLLFTHAPVRISVLVSAVRVQVWLVLTSSTDLKPLFLQGPVTPAHRLDPSQRLSSKPHFTVRAAVHAVLVLVGLTACMWSLTPVVYWSFCSSCVWFFLRRCPHKLWCRVLTGNVLTAVQAGAFVNLTRLTSLFVSTRSSCLSLSLSLPLCMHNMRLSASLSLCYFALMPMMSPGTLRISRSHQSKPTPSPQA